MVVFESILRWPAHHPRVAVVSFNATLAAAAVTDIAVGSGFPIRAARAAAVRGSISSAEAAAQASQSFTASAFPSAPACSRRRARARVWPSRGADPRRPARARCRGPAHSWLSSSIHWASLIVVTQCFHVSSAKLAATEDEAVTSKLDQRKAFLRWRTGQAAASRRQQELVATEGARPAVSVGESRSALNALDLSSGWPAARDPVSQDAIERVRRRWARVQQRAKRASQER